METLSYSFHIFLGSIVLDGILYVNPFNTRAPFRPLRINLLLCHLLPCHTVSWSGSFPLLTCIVYISNRSNYGNDWYNSVTNQSLAFLLSRALET